MSDEPPRPGEGQVERRHTGIWEHWCEHPGCKAWGSYGYGFGKMARWFCHEHRPEE